MRAQRFCSRGSSWPFIRNTLYIRRLNGCCSSSEKPFLATTSTSSSSTIATPFSADTDNELKSFGCRVLRTPVQASKANAYCERLIGTIQREFLDWVILLSEKHLRRMLREWGCTLQSRTPTCKSGTRDSRTDQRANAKPKESEARAAAGLSNKNKGCTRRIAS